MFRRTVIAIIAGLIMSLIGSPVSFAEVDGANTTADLYYSYYTVVDKSVISTDWTDMSQIIATCKVSGSGTRCTINSGSTATITVSTSLGASVKTVSSSLGLSAGKSVTVSTSCTSPSLKSGQTYRAAAVGTRYRYKVQKVTRMDGRVVSKQTSGWLYAFKPNPTRIHCGV